MNRGEVEELVQSTVRKMNTGPEACLTNPRVLSFFNIMKDSFHRCLKTLAASSGTPEERTAAYQAILTWPQERIAEEVELILKRYPSVKDSYTYAAVYIVEQTYKKDGNQLKLKLPSFQSFVYNFYTTMVQSEPLQNGTYDTLQFFEKEMLTCQSFCNALYNSIKTEPIVKPQSVVIEPSAVITPNNTGSTSRAAATAAPASSRVATPGASQVASASRFSVRALSPQDSVSQMRAPTSSSNNTFRGLLTEEFLNKHRQQVQGGGGTSESKSQVSAASQAAASIKKAASKKPSVKVIDILEHPQRHLATHVDTESSDSSTEEDDSGSFAFQKYSQVDPRVKVVKDSGSSRGSRDRRDDDRDRDRDHDRRDRDHSDRDHDRREQERYHDRSSRVETGRSRQNPNRRH